MSRTNSEATSGHSDVPKLQLWNIPELREYLTLRSAEVIRRPCSGFQGLGTNNLGHKKLTGKIT